MLESEERGGEFKEEINKHKISQLKIVKSEGELKTIVSK